MTYTDIFGQVRRTFPSEVVLLFFIEQPVRIVLETNSVVALFSTDAYSFDPQHMAVVFRAEFLSAYWDQRVNVSS